MPSNPDELEARRGFVHARSWRGLTPKASSEEEARVALEKAFDFRGDVTITKKDGSKIEGYIFDRRTGKTLADSIVRLFPKDRDEKVSVSCTRRLRGWRLQGGTPLLGRAGRRG